MIMDTEWRNNTQMRWNSIFSDSLSSASKEVHNPTDNVKIKMKNLQQFVSQNVRLKKKSPNVVASDSRCRESLHNMEA